MKIKFTNGSQIICKANLRQIKNKDATNDKVTQKREIKMQKSLAVPSFKVIFL